MPRAGTPYQDTQAWRDERRTGYGASDAPILVEGDEAAWRQLHGEKLGLLPDRVATETMELGRRLEDPIARAVAERIGRRLYRVNHLLRHPELPYVFASLDRRRSLGKRLWRPVEIKKWGFKGDEFGPAGSDIVPARFLYQGQQQLAVTGADAVEFWVLFGGSRLEPFVVGRDENIIREILDLETAAWRYVEEGQMPPWPGAAPRRIVLGADEVPVDDTIRDLVILHEDLATAKKRAERELEDAKGRLRAVLADAGSARGVLADGRRVSIAHRPTEPAPQTEWHLVAQAYRRFLEEQYAEEGVPLEVREELDGLEAMFTTTPEPQRPLRVTVGKERARAAA